MESCDIVINRQDSIKFGIDLEYIINFAEVQLNVSVIGSYLVLWQDINDWDSAGFI